MNTGEWGAAYLDPKKLFALYVSPKAYSPNIPVEPKVYGPAVPQRPGLAYTALFCTANAAAKVAVTSNMPLLVCDDAN